MRPSPELCVANPRHRYPHARQAWLHPQGQYDLRVRSDGHGRRGGPEVELNNCPNPWQEHRRRLPADLPLHKAKQMKNAGSAMEDKGPPAPALT